MTFWKWSRTAATNGTADSTCPFPEGMAPSAINDGVRGAMAALAKYRDDEAGGIATGGTSTAYTVASYQGFDTLAHMDGAMIAFTPHATNGATVTINVDGLGAKPLRTAPGVELLAGTIIQGTPYAATYNNSNGEWILRGYFGNAFNVPLAGCMDYFGTSVPNSCFAFPAGQAISRSTYSALFAIMGATYGAGDGATTFNLPDLTGRVTAMKEAAASRLSATYFGADSTAMGSVGGVDHNAYSIAQANLPAVNFILSIALPNYNVLSESGSASLNHGDNGFAAMGPVGGVSGGYSIPAQPAGSASGTAASGGSGTALNVKAVQPTIICNKILRII